MKKLVVFDSQYGNTKIIAEKIAAGAEAEIIHIKDANDVIWADLDLLIIGAPTQGGRPTQRIYELLNNMHEDDLKNTKVAAFDTRFDVTDQGFFLKKLMGIIKYAAEKIDKLLTNKGGRPIIKPEGFFVTGKEGPLRKGEEDRAMAWGQKIISL